jgi:hypothetical protein
MHELDQTGHISINLAESNIKLAIICKCRVIYLIMVGLSVNYLQRKDIKITSYYL